ncbi:aminopeptidase P family protein [Atopobacter phocae]|uniref:aminopeptidase P family protein n=1 Tax=Atopobacter phocae TaxID=136492 RepID=UPI0004B023DA|nr:aminopeptidase P family protein [Atopobacter phocae]
MSLSIKDWLTTNQQTGALFTSKEAIRDLAGYETDPHERIIAYYIDESGAQFLFVPFLEENMAKEKVLSMPVYSYQDGENPFNKIAHQIHQLQKQSNMTIAIEYDHFNYYYLKSFEAAHLNSWGADLSRWLEEKRMIKSKEELGHLFASGKIAEKMVQFIRDHLVEGVTEIELVQQAELAMRQLGVKEFSFGTIVLFGDHAADPHGEPGQRQLQKNEWVLMDLGVMWEGYASDITRMTFFGEKDVDSLDNQKVYDVVLRAHHTAMQQAKIGMTASELDQIARSIIEEAGYGDAFIHRLGHGIGRTAHEFPSIVGGNDLVLKEGMCFSIEPGIYLSNQIGVRVEDCGVLTKDGFQSFTSSPYANEL